MRVAKLLSQKDVPNHITCSEENYGPDYLWHLVNNFPNNEKPLIIFTTPELLSRCTGKNGPIHMLAVKRILSLIVLDEFDYINGCHQQHRSEYTTIIPDLKHSVERLHVPFLYLSATGSNCRLHDILFTIPNLQTTPSPILVQTKQIVPQNHIYKGTNCILHESHLSFLTCAFVCSRTTEDVIKASGAAHCIDS